jgi:DNA-binding response OmpR family regulator
MGRRTLLLVEDDAPLRQQYRIALAFEGFEVREAATGLDAITSIDRWPPDLIVLDLMLPTVNGFEVLQELAAQAHTREIPVVVVTGSPERLDYLDVACVLRKPISPDDLIRTVRRCIASRGPVAS